MFRRSLLFLAFFLLTSTAWGQRPGTPESQSADAAIAVPGWITHPKVSPALLLMAQIEKTKGRSFVPKSIVVELSVDLSPDVISLLRKNGANVVRKSSRVLHIGRYLGLRLEPGAMERLVTLDIIRQFDAPAPVFPFPLNVADDVQSGHEIMEQRLGHRSVGNIFSSDGELLRGAGVLTNVTDFNLDPFHPLLFHADGGVHDWVDVNENGVFDAEIDGIDLDDDGAISGMEILRLAEFPVVVLQQGGPVTNSDGKFTPYSDYVFMDQNANGQRDVGDAIEATAYTPGLSEPTFVGDDVNRNGLLDLGERLYLLGTPKIKAIYDVGSDKTYNPGPGFSEYLTNIRSGRSQDDIEFHGTYECTRVSGGHGEIWHQGGIAPSSDIIFVDIESGSTGPGSGDLVSALAWSRDLGARAFNYAYGEVVSNFADGSSILEGLMAELHATGRIQSASAGNEAGSGRHGMITIPAGGSADVPFWVGGQHFSPDTVFFVFRWPGTNLVNIPQVTLPDGMVVEGIPTETISTNKGDAYVMAGGGSSPRGNGLMYRAFSMLGGANLPKGSWTVRVQNNGGTPLKLDIWVATSFSWPLAWVDDDSISTDAQTITYPATADGIFAVGACSIFEWTNYGPSDCPLAGYSSRGPRIDGVRQLSFVAPTDLLSGYPLLKYSGGYIMFGGTSGASPHVTGTAALMLQANPELEYLEPNDLFMAGLSKDTELGAIPNDTWGHGILDVWSSVLPELAQGVPNSGTTLKVDAPQTVEVGGTFNISVDVVGAGDISEGATLATRVDLGYDGVYDVGPSEGAQLELTAPSEPGVLLLRVQSTDGKGGLWDAVVEVLVEESATDPELVSGDATTQTDASADAGPVHDLGGTVEQSGGCASGPTDTLGLGGAACLLWLVVSSRRRRRHYAG